MGKGDPLRRHQSVSTPTCARSPTASTSRAWPQGSRLIARRTKLKEGDQQSFADHDGYRLAVFLTDQPDDDRSPARPDPPRARPRRGPHPPSQGLRPVQPPVPQLRAEPGVAMARSARPRPRRLDPAALPCRPSARVGAQTAALPPATPVRPDRPPRPPNDPAPLTRLALGRPARRRVRAPASAPSPDRLTAAPLAPPPTATLRTPPGVSLPTNRLPAPK